MCKLKLEQSCYKKKIGRINEQTKVRRTDAQAKLSAESCWGNSGNALSGNRKGILNHLQLHFGSGKFVCVPSLQFQATWGNFYERHSFPSAAPYLLGIDWYWHPLEFCWYFVRLRIVCTEQLCLKKDLPSLLSVVIVFIAIDTARLFFLFEGSLLLLFSLFPPPLIFTHNGSQLTMHLRVVRLLRFPVFQSVSLMLAFL